MASPAFGFSFGDIVTAIKILNDVRRALQDTGGSKDEVQHVQVELQHLQILLTHLHYGTWDHGGDAGRLNAIKGMASTCQVPLQDFLTKVEKYKLLQVKELEGFRARFKAEARKVQWAVGMKEEVEKFRAIIVAKVATITLLIQSYLMETMFKIEATSRAILDSSLLSQNQTQDCQEGIHEMVSQVRMANVEHTSLNGRIDRLVEICTGTKVGVEDFRRLGQAHHLATSRHLKRLQHEQNRGFTIMASRIGIISSKVTTLEDLVRHLVGLFGEFTSVVLKILKRSLKTDLEIYALLREVHFTILKQPIVTREDSILFTDALGRTRTLQYEFFRHWEVFESMLKCEFKQKPGEQRVIQQQYHLLRASRAEELIIDRKRWERNVFPGSNISMSMVIAGLLFQQDLCPRYACGARNSSSDGSTLVVCSNCHLEYHCAEVSVTRPQIMVDTRDDFHMDARKLGGHDMFRGRNYERVRDTTPSTPEESAKLAVLADDYSIEEELEAFKAIHIQTRSRVEELSNKDDALEYMQRTTEVNPIEEVDRGMVSVDTPTIEDDKVVNYGRIRSEISVFRVPTPEPGTIASSSRFWPQVKIVLQRRAGERTNIIDAIDSTLGIIGHVDAAAAIGLTLLFDRRFDIRMTSSIPRRPKRKGDQPPGAQVSCRHILDLDIFGPKKYALHIGRHLSENNLRLLSTPFFEPVFEAYNPHDMQNHIEDSKIEARDVQTPLQKIDADSEEEENETENSQGKRDDDDQSPENHLEVHNSQETSSKAAPSELDHTFHTTPESRLSRILGESLEFTEILGIGPYSVVYLAIDLLTTMAYAVKALSKYDANRRPLDTRQTRFQQSEIRIHYTASSHPNVVSMHKIFDDPDCTYIILDYYPDGDLFYNITEKGRYVGDDASIRTAFLQIVGAVAHCHQLGIYHRDLKPENILINGSILALNDFSLATTSVYSEDHGCGSTFYMSPECLAKPAEGALYKCAPNDIWSLGVILINLISGRNPWKQASLEDPTYGAFTRSHDFLKSILPLSDEVNDILITIFEPDPDKRITITELEAAIVRCSSFYNGSFEIRT